MLTIYSYPFLSVIFIHSFIFPQYLISLCVLSKSVMSDSFCDPMYCSLPGSSVHGVLQPRILEQLLFPPPGDLPDPGIKPCLCLLHWLAGSFVVMACLF